MKKINLVSAMALTIAATNSQAVILNFANSTTAGIQGVDFNYTVCNDIDFTAGAETRMCSPDNISLGSGGGAAQKDTINGTESWAFDSNGVLSSVTNTGTTTGVNEAYLYDASGDPAGGLAIDQGFDFFNNNFSYLAPTLGSGAGDLYGEGVYTETSETSFEIFFPVLEGQWAGVISRLGSKGDKGITFYGTTDGTNFSMWAEHTIAPGEDLNFAVWTTQWYYVGTIITEDIVVDPYFVPVPAAVWLFGSGILGLAGVARRRKTL